MIGTLHDLIYQKSRRIVYTGSCMISVVSRRGPAEILQVIEA